MNSTNPLQYVSWTWTVKSTARNAVCPTAAEILGTFAIVNVLVAQAGIIFGNRTVVNRISCRLFGRLGSRGWLYMWLLTFGLHIGANVLVAKMIKHTKGYESDFAISELTIFLVMRPRIGWVYLCFCSGATRPTGHNDDIEYVYLGAFLSQFIAEIIFQFVNLYITGSIVHFAAIHGYYILRQALPHGAYLMYVGALLYTVTLPCTLVLFLLFYRWKGGVPLPHTERHSEEEKVAEARIIAIRILALGLAATTWVSSWLIWTGYVKLMGNLYCPPSLFQQGLIWTAFSSIGIFAGSGL